MTDLHSPSTDPRAFLRSLFDAAVEAALPKASWFAGLEPPKGRTVVIGAGKAAATMARALEEAWPRPGTGLVITRYGHQTPTSWIEVVQAAHPIPDEAGLLASSRILGMVSHLTRDDLVVALISGGGSSLLTLPANGVSLTDKQRIGAQLLRSGATIREINTVRKALSAVKGGKLLSAAQPARVVTFVISDVPDDDLSVVASGPTLPDRTPPGEALAVLERYEIRAPNSVREHLLKASPSKVEQPQGEAHLVASASLSLQTAAKTARRFGIPAHILSSAVEGEAKDVAKVHAAIALNVAGNGEPFTRPCVLLSGGETSVTVRGQGRGGRNVEFLASLAMALNGHPAITTLAADTDGIDGSEPVAGAFADPTTWARAGALLPNCLAQNDTHSLFQVLGDQVITGPTFTNVNDFRAIFIDNTR